MCDVMAGVVAIFLINVSLFCSACPFLQCRSVPAAASPAWGLAGCSHPVRSVPSRRAGAGPEEPGPDLPASGHGLRGRACAGSVDSAEPRSAPAARPWHCPRCRGGYWFLPSLIQGLAPSLSGSRGGAEVASGSPELGPLSGTLGQCPQPLRVGTVPACAVPGAGACCFKTLLIHLQFFI